MMIVGLDLSLTATGLAYWSHNRPVKTVTIRTNPDVPMVRRWLQIWNGIAERIVPEAVVVIEAQFLGRHGGMMIDMCGLRGVVLYNAHCLYHTVEVRTQHLRIYAAGTAASRGENRVDKDAVMLAVERRYGDQVQVRNNNEADALVLLAMGMHHYGYPLAPVPKRNEAALDKIKWPTIKDRM